VNRWTDKAEGSRSNKNTRTQGDTSFSGSQKGGQEPAKKEKRKKKIQRKKERKKSPRNIDKRHRDMTRTQPKEKGGKSTSITFIREKANEKEPCAPLAGVTDRCVTSHTTRGEGRGWEKTGLRRVPIKGWMIDERDENNRRTEKPGTRLGH